MGSEGECEKKMDLRTVGFSVGVGVRGERSKGAAQFLACVTKVTEEPQITAFAGS